MDVECDKTIYTISDASDYKGLSIVKISGNKALEIAETLTTTNKLHTNKANFLPIHNPFTKEFIDKCYILKFPPTDSFTGENMIEIHLHSNKTILKSFRNAIYNFPFLEKGGMEDFLERRVKNKKINQLQLKAVYVLASHPNDANKKEALYFLTTNFDELYSSWYKEIAHLIELINKYKSSNKITYKMLDYLSAEIDKITYKITKHFFRISKFLDTKTDENFKSKDNIIYLNKYYEAYARLFDIPLENEVEHTKKAIMMLKNNLEKLIATNDPSFEKV